MKERRVLVKAFAEGYRKVRKKEKSQILDRFVAATGYRRRYAARLLRGQGRRLGLGGGVVAVADHGVIRHRCRRRVYGPEVVAVLKQLWQMLDYLSGKRLAAALPALIEALQRHRELLLSAEVKGKLLRISAATIDRVLAPAKRRLQLRGRGATKPGTLLRHQVPIRTYQEWDDARPGFVEVDLVGHDGGFSQGDYAQTLVLTDVASGWTEARAVRNKAQVWVFEALQQIRAGLPFPLLGLDSDNGSEFINNHLVRYCQQEQITFTRSRPWRKNDNCFVEQKNYSVVRRFAGYGRYNEEADVDLLNQLYQVLRDYVNFFLPSLKLQAKTRQGSRVHKSYQPAQTPSQRLLQSGELSRPQKAGLKQYAQGLNPAQLHRSLARLQEQLIARSARRQQQRAVDGDASAGKDKTLPTAAWKTPKQFSTPPTAPAAKIRNSQ